MKKFTFIFLLFFFFLVSCVTVGNYHTENTKSPVAEISGKLKLDKVYELVGIQSKNGFVVLEPEHGNGGLINFHSDGSVEVHSGINFGHGSYKYTPKNTELDLLIISNLGITKMAGENEQANYFDSIFFQNLQACRYVRFESDIIKLFDASKNNILNFLLKR